MVLHPKQSELYSGFHLGVVVHRRTYVGRGNCNDRGGKPEPLGRACLSRGVRLTDGSIRKSAGIGNLSLVAGGTAIGGGFPSPRWWDTSRSGDFAAPWRRRRSNWGGASPVRDRIRKRRGPRVQLVTSSVLPVAAAWNQMAKMRFFSGRGRAVTLGFRGGGAHGWGGEEQRLHVMGAARGEGHGGAASGADWHAATGRIGGAAGLWSFRERQERA